LPEIGPYGQEQIKNAKVLLIGVGGLGAPLAIYLAAAGVGALGLIDDDRVELSNLARQIAFETGDIGRVKVEAAADRLEELNPDVRVVPHAVRLDTENADRLIAEYDLVCDGSDRFATRFVVQEACHRLQKTLVSGAVRGWEGQLSTFTPHLGPPHPCYRCLVPGMPAEPQDCAAGGVLGAIAGVMGALMATEAVKELVGGPSMSGRLLRYDGWRGTFRETRLMRDPACSLCGNT
jgi:adenylyltransferase/sulfurtransferase